MEDCIKLAWVLGSEHFKLRSRKMTIASQSATEQIKPTTPNPLIGLIQKIIIGEY